MRWFPESPSAERSLPPGLRLNIELHFKIGNLLIDRGNTLLSQPNMFRLFQGSTGSADRRRGFSGGCLSDGLLSHDAPKECCANRDGCLGRQNDAHKYIPAIHCVMEEIPKLKSPTQDRETEASRIAGM